MKSQFRNRRKRGMKKLIIFLISYLLIVLPVSLSTNISHQLLYAATVGGGGGAAGGYDTIKDEDSGLTQRTNLNFTGTGVACVDDAVDTTDCTINTTPSASANYYVDTGTGNDSNACTASGASACATLQGVVDKLPGLLITQNVTINITEETYSELFTIAENIFPGDYYITITGWDGTTEGKVTVAASGTATAASQYVMGSAGNGVTRGTLTDSGETWGTNIYQKGFIHLTAGTGFDSTDDDLNWYVIASHTNDVITIIGPWNTTPSTDTTFDIIDTLDSVIDCVGNTRAYNALVHSDRIKFKNIRFEDCSTTNIHFSEGTRHGSVVASYLTSAAGKTDTSGANIGGIGEFKAIANYSEVLSAAKNISVYVLGSSGYDTDFVTGGALVASNTGIRNNWLQDGSEGVTLDGAHARLTGNYITSTTINAISCKRLCSTTLYANEITSPGTSGITLESGSYLRLHSGNEIDGATANNILATHSNIELRNAGGFGTSQINNAGAIGLLALAGTKVDNSNATPPSYSSNTDYDIIATPFGVEVNISGAEAITTSSATFISFDDEQQDIYGLHDTSTNPDRVQIPLNGWYDMSCAASFAANSSGRRQLFISQGAAPTHMGIQQYPAYTSGGLPMAMAVNRYLVAGEYVKCGVFQDSGGDLNIQDIDEYSAFFTVKYDFDKNNQ